MAFIIQNSNGTDPSYGASGSGLTALGAGAGPNQSGALGYAGINNNLAVEFDIHQDPWDPNSSHVAVQTAEPGRILRCIRQAAKIGTHQNVPNCLPAAHWSRFPQWVATAVALHAPTEQCTR